MKTQRWYPSKMADMPEWNDNFIVKLPGYETPLGLLPAHVDACIASLKYMNYVIGIWLVAVRNFGLTATSAVELLLLGSGPAPVPLPEFAPAAIPSGVAGVPPGVLDRLFALAGLIKASPGYTDTIGKDLGIVAKEDATEHPVPDYTLKLEQGAGVQTVRIDFTKYGHQGVYIESRVNNGTWSFLAIDTLKPYIDAPAGRCRTGRGARISSALARKRRTQRRLEPRATRHRRNLSRKGNPKADFVCCPASAFVLSKGWK